MPRPSTHLKLTGDDALAASVNFSLWKVSGHKTLLHDGAGMLLTAQINHEILRLTLDAGIQEDRPFAFLLSARPDARASWPIVSAVLALFASPKSSRSAATPRPNRQLMLHLRALQALDGEAAGASHREIAEVIFGAQDIFQRWTTNSELLSPASRSSPGQQRLSSTSQQISTYPLGRIGEPPRFSLTLAVDLASYLQPAATRW